MNNTCFVVMPIGYQEFGNLKITAEQLREKYDSIIKEAILKADSTLEVIRADDEISPSCMSNDIFMKLMHSKYVIADVTYPNPNVFYELGIRHAIKTGTILIREKIDLDIPFDISHLRCIEYNQTPVGLSKLSDQFKKLFAFYESNPVKPDNQFLELCSFTNYSPISYSKEEKDTKSSLITKMFMLFFQNPNLITSLANPDLTDAEKQQMAIIEFAKNPQSLEPLVKMMADTGFIKLD